MYIMRKKLEMSFPKIGQVLGGKDHTTIMHGVNLIAKNKTENIELQKQIEEIEQRLSVV